MVLSWKCWDVAWEFWYQGHIISCDSQKRKLWPLDKPFAFKRRNRRNWIVYRMVRRKISLHHNITIRESDFESGLMHLIRKTKKLLVKPVSCLNPKKPKDVFLAQNLVDKMKGALRLLALEQINILSSEDEHVIIDSPYGSGKSIIVRVTGKILCDRLLENEVSCCMLMVQVVLCHIKY